MTLLKPLLFSLAGTAILSTLLVADTPIGAPTTAPSADRKSEQRLCFQTGGPWDPQCNLNADVAMCYGINPSLPDRMKSWRDHGYETQLMTGVAWGEYQDYLYGKFDGKNHEDEAQVDKTGNKVTHGGDVYYMSPGPDYGDYLAAGVLKACDAGATAVYLEEPEFWVKSGWSEGFKREWKDYYHEDWQAPDTSPDTQYRASKLKYFLYRRALGQVFAAVKKWGDDHHTKIPCYVATHSLINYAHWAIVSPESSLLDVGCDGYIAQVWTGTARTPNVYEGVKKERTFEAAFCEYGAMQNLVRASGRRVWYLNDPIEDNRNHTWTDYRSNWESTLTASLLQPEVDRFEIMPWPQRIFHGKYPTTAPVTKTSERSPIPPEYETELQSVITALGDMKQPLSETKWEVCGTQGIGVLVADTMMFQRGDPSPSDENLGSFYGLAMPLLKRGMPVEPVQIESVARKADFLSRYKVLLLTYEGQKPPTPEFHDALADWVKAGGSLVVIDSDSDPYDKVREWWNTAPMNFATPRGHLFQKLGLNPSNVGNFKVGKGNVVYASRSPARLTYEKDGGDQVRELVHEACDRGHVPYVESNALVLRRGPYLIAAGLTQSVPDAAPVKLKGKFVPLFDAGLPVLDGYEVTPGSRAVLVDLGVKPAHFSPGSTILAAGQGSSIVAAACREPSTVEFEGGEGEFLRLRMTVDGIEASPGILLLRGIPHAPKAVAVDGAALPAADWQYDRSVRLLRVHFTNRAAGVTLQIN
jgi:hypothetical protein